MDYDRKEVITMKKKAVLIAFSFLIGFMVKYREQSDELEKELKQRPLKP